VKDKDTTTTKEAAMQPQKTESSFVRQGVLPGVVHLAIDVAEKGQSTAIAVLQDARIELRAAVEQGIELAEKVTAAGFRFARKAVQRFDDAANDTLTGTERVLSGAVKTARETANAAAQLATTATTGITAAA
jgi:hypothetical protein